ncbi:MAG: CoA pyrophosphatase [Pseudomonadota bacterium]
MTGAEVSAALAAAVAHPGAPSSDYDLSPDAVLPKGRRLRPAAVLVCVVVGDGAPRVVLTKRSSRLKHHPGQVALPGGKIDDADADAASAALREAKEEIALDPTSVTVIGAMPPHETVTAFSVTPILATAPPFTPVPEAGEVAEVFEVPLSHLADPENFSIERRRWRGRWRSYYTVPFGPYYVWGATARIMRALADRMTA